ncbi:sugar ABC transporter substrate-binding protein [Blastococcus sp. SYSU D00820]
MFSLRTSATTVVALGASLALAACGSSDDGSSDGGSSTADTAAAEELLAPYRSQPSDFPVEEPLAEGPPAGTTIAYLQCASTFCGIFADQLQAAADEMGVELTVTNAGASASDLQTAMDSIISQDPDAVVLPGVEPSSINQQLRELEDQGIPVMSNGLINAADHGIDISFNDVSTMEIVGQVLAAWTVAEHGGDADVVFYTVPELSFSGPLEDAFNAEMAELCPDCAVRTEEIPISAIGSTAPSLAVSDLQANPDTNVAVFATLEGATGLPAALRTAGLTDLDVIGFGTTPGNLQDIESGGLAGGLAVDAAVNNWAMVDGAVRLITGQEITAGQEAGIPPLQFVEAEDLEGDLSQGFAVFPDYQERFADLWAAAS